MTAPEQLRIRERLRQRRYLEGLQQRLVDALGGRCRSCTRKAGLEFAHIKPTGSTGRGRGKKARLLDVKNNLDAYALLCRPHHLAYDRDHWTRLAGAEWAAHLAQVEAPF